MGVPPRDIEQTQRASFAAAKCELASAKGARFVRRITYDAGKETG